MSAQTRARRAGWLVPIVLAATGFAVLSALGIWQIERKSWKENLIATLAQRAASPPVALPAPDRWPALDQARDEFRRVTFRAEFLPVKPALVYSAGSALRNDAGGIGYFVFAPAKLADGAVIAVNRGFVPQERVNEIAQSAGGEMTGVLRWPEPRGLFTPADDPQKGIFFVRDPQSFAASQEWGKVPEFYVELESPAPPGGLPQPGTVRVNLRNDHLGYALTWFGLAGALAAVFAAWTVMRLREPGAR